MMFSSTVMNNKLSFFYSPPFPLPGCKAVSAFVAEKPGDPSQPELSRVLGSPLYL